MSDTKYAQYVADVTTDIANCVESNACQPILFVGSGVSRRYFDGPSWDELLAYLAAICPLIDKEYAYYKQTLKDPLKIGALFAENFQQWAWGQGRDQFPETMFTEGTPSTAYIKFAIAKHLDAITPKEIIQLKEVFQKEIASLTSIRPHAIVSTNYDRFLEVLFPEYQPIIGQQIIQGRNLSIGEIFKIHGCASIPNSIVFTEEDYAEFIKKKKYLSAKLLTFFSEHPLIFVGYGAGDPNIRAILSDIDEALPVQGGVIPNVYIVEWRPELTDTDYPAREKLIAIDDSKSVRIKAVETADFAWVFDAFASQQPLNGISPKILRALLSRSYELVRHDIPRKVVQADFQMLEHAAEDQEAFAKLFGITTVSEPSAIAANYPHTLTAVGIALKSNSWAKAQQAIDIIRGAHKIDIKTSDNRYHCATKYGKSTIHKYSQDAVYLFAKVLKGEAYELHMPGRPPIAVPARLPTVR